MSMAAAFHAEAHLSLAGFVPDRGVAFEYLGRGLGIAASGGRHILLGRSA
jgi:hypothetical protein